MSEPCKKCGADISFQGDDHTNCDEVVRLRAALEEILSRYDDDDLKLTVDAIQASRAALKKASGE